MSEEKRYGIAPEVAAMYRTSPAVIYQWAREGRFPANAVLRIGKKLLFDMSALEIWASNGGTPIKSSEQQAA